MRILPPALTALFFAITASAQTMGAAAAPELSDAAQARELMRQAVELRALSAKTSAEYAAAGAQAASLESAARAHLARLKSKLASLEKTLSQKRAALAPAENAAKRDAEYLEKISSFLGVFYSDLTARAKTAGAPSDIPALNADLKNADVREKLNATLAALEKLKTLDCEISRDGETVRTGLFVPASGSRADGATALLTVGEKSESAK